MTEKPACPACEGRARQEWKTERDRLSATPVADVPELVAAWADDADPHEVMVAGQFGAYRFRCPRGHRSRLAPERYLAGGCPSCRASSTRATPKLLAEVLPEITSQWHPTRNGKLTPENVVWNSKRDIWWRADCCGHEWQQRVVDRDKYQRLRCPACRTILGSLAWHDPGLAAEWSPANPRTPCDVRPHATVAFVPEWICATDTGHVWKMPLSSRANGAECPQCRPTGKSLVELNHHAAAEEIFGAAQSGTLLRELAFAARKSWSVDVLVSAAVGSVSLSE